MPIETCAGCGANLISFLPRERTDILFVFDYPGDKEIRANSMLIPEAGRAVTREISIAKFSPQEYNMACFIGHLPSKGKGSRVITTDPCWAISTQRLITICKLYKHIMFMGNDMCRAIWDDVKADEWYGLNIPHTDIFPTIETIMCVPSLRELAMSTIGEFQLGMKKFRRATGG